MHTANKSYQVPESAHKIDKRLYDACLSTRSVSSRIAVNPSLTPGEVWDKLFSHHQQTQTERDIRDVGIGIIPPEEVRKTCLCGKWGPENPSDLFLRIYHDSLCTLNENPACGVVSPSLMGTSGTVPLTIISVIPDIVRHMSNMIVRAEHDVFLATNFWQRSVASKYITDAMKELSRRAGQRGSKVVMKIIYDRGSPKQLFEPHYIVREHEYTDDAVGLPAAHEIPNIELQVMNYHHPMLGTFHSKFMIVDQKMGIVQSNNIQDSDNLEMMVQVEGPIVDALYDMALLTWHGTMSPPLPTHNTPALTAAFSSFGESHARLITPDGTLDGHSALVDPNKMPGREAFGAEAAVDFDARTQDDQRTRRDFSQQRRDSGVDFDDDTGTVSADELSTTTNTIPEHTTDDPNYDTDIAGEVLRVQAAVTAKPGETQAQAISRHLNHTVNKGFPGSAPECEPVDEMTPYIPHAAHEPFPMALVNRWPYGQPNHRSISCPQNAAWLSALRNAQKNVFIQTPTLNTEPLLPAIVEACHRGVEVYCYVCLGYNDTGELLPMQGGHNEMIAHQLYASLSPAAKQHLHYYWYVGKDQTRPIVQEKRRRSCHIKLMIADERVGIAGSGNQDTQSWFQSQEVNVLLDSAAVCRAWIEALRRAQNTHRYGRLDPGDGVWRDGQGREADGAMGVDPGRFSWARGFVGAIKRVQGTGGF
ncbi:IQ calmodulin-binding motif protein [Xylariomycetidae sp. FL2044]|nr:IQ calmodulin-binding motif protein [Xylariomycetidae sp. FL2044]